MPPPLPAVAAADCSPDPAAELIKPAAAPASLVLQLAGTTLGVWGLCTRAACNARPLRTAGTDLLTELEGTNGCGTNTPAAAVPSALPPAADTPRPPAVAAGRDVGPAAAFLATVAAGGAAGCCIALSGWGSRMRPSPTACFPGAALPVEAPADAAAAAAAVAALPAAAATPAVACAAAAVCGTSGSFFWSRCCCLASKPLARWGGERKAAGMQHGQQHRARVKWQGMDSDSAKEGSYLWGTAV